MIKLNKIRYSIPYDLLILFMPIIPAFVMCITHPDNLIIANMLFVYTVGFLCYYAINKWLSNKGERRCKYLTYWNILGNKNHVFISMYNGKCKANEGNEKPGETEEEIFNNEVKNARNYLAGAKCITCTHAKYYREIRKVASECEKKEAYMGSLNRVRRYLNMPCRRKKAQFYRVTFRLPNL